MINHKQRETLKEKSVRAEEDLTLWADCSGGEKPLSAHLNTISFLQSEQSHRETKYLI